MQRSHAARAFASALILAAVSIAGLAPAATAVETRTISGVVTLPGGPDSRALDAITIYVYNEAGTGAGTVNVSPSGTFSATGLAPGRYALCANPGGYVQADGTYTKGPYNVLSACLNTPDRFGTKGTVDVTNGDLANQTVALPWGLTISGTVSLPPGADP